MSKLVKVPARNKYVRKMVRYEYPEPEATGDVGKTKLLVSNKPLTAEPSSIEESPRKNITPTKPRTVGTAKNFISENIKAVTEKDTNARPKKSDTSIRKIYDRKESRSKRGVMAYKDGLMAKLLHQNYLAEERMRKERRNRISSFFPLPYQNCEESIESKVQSGDSGDGENREMISDENNNSPPTLPTVIKRTKTVESVLKEDELPIVKEKSKKTPCPGPDIDRHQKILVLEEDCRLKREENHVLKKRVRKLQQLKVENFVLTETISKLEKDIEVLVNENKELQCTVLAFSNKHSDALDHNNQDRKGLNLSQSYTITTTTSESIMTGTGEACSDIKKSYSSRLLSMEQRVSDIVSILEIMKTLVVEQKLSSEGTEKRFLEFMAEANMVSLLQSLLKILSSSKVLTSSEWKSDFSAQMG